MGRSLWGRRNIRARILLRRLFREKRCGGYHITGATAGREYEFAVTGGTSPATITVRASATEFLVSPSFPFEENVVVTTGRLVPTYLSFGTLVRAVTLSGGGTARLFLSSQLCELELMAAITPITPRAVIRLWQTPPITAYSARDTLGVSPASFYGLDAGRYGYGLLSPLGLDNFIDGSRASFTQLATITRTDSFSMIQEENGNRAMVGCVFL